MSILDLPQEIRDAIYDLVIPTKQHFQLGPIHLDFDLGLTHVHRQSNSRTPQLWLSLFCVSKQIHHEVAARLYGANALSVSSYTKGRRDGEDYLETFGFAGLVPIHPAYVRFVKDVTLEIRRSIRHSEAESAEVLRIARPPDYAATPPPLSPRAQVDHFLRSAQRSLDAVVACSCMKILSLGAGHYILCRPPSPERVECHAATWHEAKSSCAVTIEEMQQGRFRGLDPRRRKSRIHNWGFALALGFVCCCCFTVPALVLWVHGKDAEKTFKKWRARRRGR